MACTLKEVAARAKVSRTAVSYALRGTGRLDPETRERIRRIAHEMGYRPNLLVQGIQTGRTQTVGVMVPPRSAFFGQTLAGIQDELLTADYAPIALSTGRGTIELDQIHRLIDHRVDGIILAPRTQAVSDDYLRAIWDRDVPLVTVDTEVPETRHADFVGTDDALGGRLAAAHLLGLGHRRLACVAKPGPLSPIQLRRAGFEQTVLATPDAACRAIAVRGTDDLHGQTRGLLANGLRPSAVFVTDDRHCPAVYRAAAELGLAIPDDLSVVGFADLDIAAVMSPPLTTVRQHPYEIGRRAARLLLERIEHPEADRAPRKVRLAPELIVRQSTAPLAPAHSPSFT
ncbi:LacI family DNA-binding transcriptional regulator [Planctomycetota bacterium]